MKFKIFLAFCFLAILNTEAQQATLNSNKVEESLQKKTKRQQESLVKNVPFQNIGPTVMSGRVVDLAVNPENSTEFYVGYASGGL